MPDATDDRAQLVVLTERGRALVQVAYEAAEEVDREWSKRLGAERFRDLEEALVELSEVEG